MLIIKCPNCHGKFGIDEDMVIVNGNRVSVEFRCPYCGDLYEVGDAVNIKGVTGGVNIGGSVSVSGDIVGRDKRG